MNEPPITVEVAARRLGLSRRAVLYRIAKGQLKATKIGAGQTSAYLIEPDDLQRMLKVVA